jgi:hypothetical protein
MVKSWKIMNDKREEDLLARMLKESATEQAPDHFSQAVMDRIRAGEATWAQPAPLIPRWGWGLIGTAVAALVGWGWFTGRGAGEGLLPVGYWKDWLGPSRLPAWDLPSVPLSLVYGAAALAVFMLVHVVWMRLRLERQWSF